ncbi:MAG TPA: c-type cytochrome [Steroidobacteraceae bacterium]|nr:c-type cytochrome [Steroidobacteraceae bacterium]
MKMSRLFVVGLATLGLAGWSLSASADAAAGKAKFDATCADCHEAGDFEGEDAAALADSLKQIVGGQLKHKQALKLSDQEIADVAAYMASGGK